MSISHLCPSEKHWLLNDNPCDSLLAVGSGEGPSVSVVPCHICVNKCLSQHKLGIQIVAWNWQEVDEISQILINKQKMREGNIFRKTGKIVSRLPLVINTIFGGTEKVAYGETRVHLKLYK